MKYEVFYGKNNGYCYKDEQGKIVSKTYKYAHPFDENGIALVCGFFDDYYYINEKFEKISPVYHFASDFFTVGNKRMAVTQENSKSDWYFIDQNFKKISPPFSSLFSIWCSDYYNNNDKLPFITLNCTDYSDTNFPDYYLDTNFQQVSPRYRSTGKFKYFAPLDENCAEVNDVVDGKTLYYLINEDFVKITHGVEKWPSDWAIFLDHIIPEKVKSNKTYSRILSGEPITQVSQTDEVQLEKTSPPAQSIVEIVKKGTSHSDNTTAETSNPANNTQTTEKPSVDTSPKETTKNKPQTPQEKKSVVELVKEGSKHTDNGNGTTGNTSSTIETQSFSPVETPREETKKSVVETVKTRSIRSKDSVAEEKTPPSDCKYKKSKIAKSNKWVFKDKNGKTVSKEYDIIGDFDDHGITNVGNFPRRHGIDNPCFYYINTNLERVSRAYDSASKFFRVGDIDMAVVQDVSDFIINRDFEKISDYYPRIWVDQIPKEDGTPFTQIKVLDRDKEKYSGYCEYFLDNNLQRISPKYNHVSFFEYKFEGIDEYFALASVHVPEEHKYISFLINEDFEIVSSQIPFTYKGDDYSQFLIPEKVKSNKTYSKLMAGETPQDELLG